MVLAALAVLAVTQIAAALSARIVPWLVTVLPAPDNPNALDCEALPLARSCAFTWMEILLLLAASSVLAYWPDAAVLTVLCTTAPPSIRTCPLVPTLIAALAFVSMRAP
ncbi:Uncharacterised protein [Bordetella pertussis]|nr:hypothetical protein FT165_18000 [Bordetella pertussis]CFN71113.1 Uncharacterised protein [Bordetella pertussis]CFO05898.1 Uncharacterised protein [Bordetella pertussis]CFO65314.1 Uncharacterised protein [Bordetella pertussis]CFP62091.1 Uncharacterised protein [Bordetella pertussis]